jgi:hypothetical protein
MDLPVYLNLLLHLSQKSGGFSFGGNYNGFGGSLGLDISKIDVTGNKHSRFSSLVNSFNIGTKNNPFPIYLNLLNISEVLKPEYWSTLPEERVTYRSLGISQKKRHLERALADYADYEGVDELKGMYTVYAAICLPHPPYGKEWSN